MLAPSQPSCQILLLKSGPCAANCAVRPGVLITSLYVLAALKTAVTGDLISFIAALAKLQLLG